MSQSSLCLEPKISKIYGLYTERKAASEITIEFVLYHFNRSDSTYKSQRIKFQDIIAACNQLIVNALN